MTGREWTPELIAERRKPLRVELPGGAYCHVRLLGAGEVLRFAQVAETEGDFLLVVRALCREDGAAYFDDELGGLEEVRSWPWDVVVAMRDAAAAHNGIGGDDAGN